MSDRHVLDASVLCKWLFKEEGWQAAEAFATGELLVPELIYTECCNVIWKRLRTRQLSLVKALDLTELVAELPLIVTQSRPLLPLALEIAATCDRTIYDAIYVALAEVEDAYVITADARLFNALSQSKWNRRVRLL